MGTAVGLLCHLPWWASAAAVWFLSFVGLRALRRAAWDDRPPGGTVGLLVALGMVVHSLGDALTSSGVPLAWPVRIDGRRWTLLGALAGRVSAPGPGRRGWSRRCPRQAPPPWAVPSSPDRRHQPVTRRISSSTIGARVAE